MSNHQPKWHGQMDTRSRNALDRACSFFGIEMDDIEAVRSALADPRKAKRVRGMGTKSMNSILEALKLPSLPETQPTHRELLDAWWNNIKSPRTCDTCRHWVPDCAPRHQGVGGCSAKLCCYPDPDEATDPVMAEVTLCGPKFGCIHWEANPSAFG